VLAACCGLLFHANTRPIWAACTKVTAGAMHAPTVKQWWRALGSRLISGAEARCSTRQAVWLCGWQESDRTAPLAQSSRQGGGCVGRACCSTFSSAWPQRLAGLCRQLGPELEYSKMGVNGMRLRISWRAGTGAAACQTEEEGCKRRGGEGGR